MENHHFFMVKFTINGSFSIAMLVITRGNIQWAVAPPLNGTKKTDEERLFFGSARAVGKFPPSLLPLAALQGGNRSLGDQAPRADGPYTPGTQVLGGSRYKHEPNLGMRN
jgi:hypothetical protein